MIGSFDENNLSRPMSEINVTPLVDVMLVLLVVFILTAPLFTHSIRVNLPQTHAQPNNEKPETVTLAIDEHGVFFWNNRPLDRAALSRALAQTAPQEPQPVLHVRADRDTRYQLIAEIMAEAKRAGLERIGLVTDPGAGK
ncbi:MAG: biopolymer transporter ExbD [Sulfuricaulis sp.]|uniref:ExbD/TolR family protein n=1 Tax=Sulfuricaulis sp. TaxID=2003553 RepID=UPI0034A2C764